MGNPEGQLSRAAFRKGRRMHRLMISVIELMLSQVGLLSKGAVRREGATGITIQVVGESYWEETSHRRTYKERDRSYRRSRYSSTSTSSERDEVVAALYEKDDCAQEKEKASKGSSTRSTNPVGTEHISADHSANINTLKVKSQRESRKRASKTVVEHISNHSTLTINTLYGQDEDVKAEAKASRTNSAYSSTPGVQQVSADAGSSRKLSTAMSTLYGNGQMPRPRPRPKHPGQVARNIPAIQV